MGGRGTRRAGAGLVALLCAIGLCSGPLAPAARAAPGPSQAPAWWFDSWSIPALWARGITGREITIAVVDTGVQAAIPELAGKVLSGVNLNGQPGDGTTDYDDAPFGHGTAMSSIMVARAGFANVQGIAPDALILPIAVPLTGSAGAGGATGDYLSEAIRWAADHGADIISMSLGGLRDPAQVSQPCPQVTQEAILYAIRKGAIVVAASGNSGESGSPVEEPGVCLGTLSVGAVDSALRVAAFSSRHPYLDATAPGVDIASLGRVAGQGFIGDGTSQATALASAALALVWSAHPGWSARTVVSALLSTAQDLGDPGPDPAYGLGFIRPDLAVDASAAGLASAANPVWDGIEPYLSESAPPPPQAPVSVPAAATLSAPPGVVAVGASPAAVSPWILGGAGGTVAALAALVALGVAGLARRPERAPPRGGPPGPPEFLRPSELPGPAGHPAGGGPV
jgi:subtilisin family serine protease